jgi:hypothetical protein
VLSEQTSLQESLARRVTSSPRDEGEKKVEKSGEGESEDKKDAEGGEDKKDETPPTAVFAAMVAADKERHANAESAFLQRWGQQFDEFVHGSRQEWIVPADESDRHYLHIHCWKFGLKHVSHDQRDGEGKYIGRRLFISKPDGWDFQIA